jgi:non-ribosomal peptide synthetase component E (peptide arylation enzyme)
MGSGHSVVIEFDDHRFQALSAEAERLQINVEQLVARAASAWMVEIAEHQSALPSMRELVAVG